MQFEWDNQNAESNLKKHRVSFIENGDSEARLK
jgi:uncharacterized DUF497 family protein